MVGLHSGGNCNGFPYLHLTSSGNVKVFTSLRSHKVLLILENSLIRTRLYIVITSDLDFVVILCIVFNQESGTLSTMFAEYIKETQVVSRLTLQLG